MEISNEAKIKTKIDNEQQEINLTSDEKITTALTINTDSLSQESWALTNQIIAETDFEKQKDLTYLFNMNQNKKTIVRVNKLNELQDNLTDLMIQRVTNKPDNMTTKEVMDALKTVQDLIERGSTQVSGTNEQAPLITINQQNNEVHMGHDTQQSRESREKVKNAVLDILSKAMDASAKNDNIIDIASERKSHE